MLRINHIIMHHSLTRDEDTVSWDAIRRYHVKELGWKDIGYHYGVELVGDTYEILVGRQLNERGAHCKQKGMNGRSVGICLIGNFDRDRVPEAQFHLAAKLVAGLLTQLDLPTGAIFNHSDFARHKTCPGEYFNLPDFVEAVKSYQ